MYPLYVQLQFCQKKTNIQQHWETAEFRVTSNVKPRTIHDFGGGLSAALYKMQYPAPGDPALAKRIVSMIQAAGLSSKEDDTWGLDHATWIPLSLMYPDANIPVLQVSIAHDLDAAKVQLSCSVPAYSFLPGRRLSLSGVHSSRSGMRGFYSSAAGA